MTEVRERRDECGATPRTRAVTFAAIIGLASLVTLVLAPSAAIAQTNRVQILCLNGARDATVLRDEPTSCAGLRHGSGGVVRTDLTQLRWTGWGQPEARAAGIECGFQTPCEYLPATLRAYRLRPGCHVNGRRVLVYTRLRVSTAVAASTLELPTCPARIPLSDVVFLTSAGLISSESSAPGNRDSRPGCGLQCLNGGTGGAQAGPPIEPELARRCGPYCQQVIDTVPEDLPRDLPEAAKILDSVVSARNGVVSVAIQCLLQSRCDGALAISPVDPETSFQHLGGTDMSVGPGEQQTVDVPLSNDARQLIEQTPSTEAFIGIFQQGKSPNSKCDPSESDFCDTSAANFRKVTIRNSATTTHARARPAASTSHRRRPAGGGRQRGRSHTAKRGAGIGQTRSRGIGRDRKSSGGTAPSPSPQTAQTAPPTPQSAPLGGQGGGVAPQPSAA